MTESRAQILYNPAGTDPIGVILDGAVYRLEAAAKVAVDNDGGLHHLKSLDDGTIAVINSSYPVADPTRIVGGFVTAPGDVIDLNVDGSTTPVVFSFDSDPTKDITLLSIDFVMVASSMKFGGNGFGPLNSALTNGVGVDLKIDGVEASFTVLQTTEDFLHFSSPGGFEYIVSSVDVMSSAYIIGGAMRLHAGAVDYLKITINDNLSSALIQYFRCRVRAVKEA